MHTKFEGQCFRRKVYQLKITAHAKDEQPIDGEYSIDAVSTRKGGKKVETISFFSSFYFFIPMNSSKRSRERWIRLAEIDK